MSNAITKRTAVFVKKAVGGGKFKYERKAFDIVEIGSRSVEEGRGFVQIFPGVRAASTHNLVGTSAVKADSVERYDDIKIVDAGEFAGQKANDIAYTDI